MNPVVYKISLDLNKPGCSTPIYIKCGEAKAREFLIYLYHGSEPYPLPRGVGAKMRAIKPDNTVIFADCTIDGNVIRYPLSEQFHAVVGTVHCEIVLYGTETNALYSPEFDVYVSETLDFGGKIESTDEFSALTEAMSKLEGITDSEADRVLAENGRRDAEQGRESAETQRKAFYEQVYQDFGTGFRGDDGATFIPSVSDAGELSWTNDSGLENPAPVNIKGPKGDNGESVPPGGTEGQVLAKVSDADFDAAWQDGGSGGEFEPVGCMKFFAGETLPSGYLWCDGASYPANGDYAKLYEILGERYNREGDDAGTFRVPDLRGRVAVGKDAGTFDIVGKTGGVERQYISRDQLPNVNINVETSGSVSEPIKLGSESSTETLLGIDIHRKAGAAWANATVRLNGGQTQKPLSNLQPYLVCNYVIKYSKSYEEIGVTAPPCVWEFAASEWQERESGGYMLAIPESEHRRGKYCVLTALYDTGEAGKLKAVLFEMEKDEAGNITIYSDAAFSGTAYIDRVYMVPAGRILTVNGQGPDMDGNVDIPAMETVQTPHGYYEKHSSGLLVEYYSTVLEPGQSIVLEQIYNTDIYAKSMDIGTPYAPFIAPPMVSVTIGRSANDNIWLGSTTVSPTASSFGSYMLMRAGSAAVMNPTCNVIATGRWK